MLRRQVSSSTPAPPGSTLRASGHVLLAAACLLTFGQAGFADDRDLLGQKPGAPYAFVILDTSGSMNWTTPCTERDDFADIDPWDGACTRECPLEDAVCQRFDIDGPGCIEYSKSADGVHEVIVDEEDGSPSVTINGTWKTVLSTFASGPVVGNQQLNDNGASKGSLSITYTPDLPVDGLYHVYAFYTAFGSNAWNVPYTVTHADGKEIYRLDQRNNNQYDPGIDAHPGTDPEHYNYLGTFRFNAGTGGSVTVSNGGTQSGDGSSDFVRIDSMRFIAASRPTGVSCNKTGYRIRQPLCPRGDCIAPMASDDPTSKLFQVKEGIYEVLDRVDDNQVLFGFATYEQDDARVQGKHWLYRVPEFKADGTRQPFFTTQFPSLGEFPMPGSQQVFGLGGPYSTSGFGSGWRCNSGGGSNADPEGRTSQVSCISGRPADADDLWEMERSRRYPKLGPGSATSPSQWNPTNVYYREPTDKSNPFLSGGQIYRATYTRRSGNFGDDRMEVDIELYECSDVNCFSSLSRVTRRFEFELVSDYAAFEFIESRHPIRQGAWFHNQRTVTAQFSGFISSNSGCFGVENNNDTFTFSSDVFDDTYEGYTHKWPTVADPDGRGPLLSIGDFIPLDWKTSHRELMMGRMAPNLYRKSDGVFDDSLGAPDFRTATYWNDQYLSGDNPDATRRKLRLKDENQRAMIAFGATPLANSLRDFFNWYVGTAANDGFLDVASGLNGDRKLECRDTNVILLTDGNETCGGDPCGAAGDLFGLDPEVKTFVVGFGLDDSESNLACIAEEGGTVEPILPRNKDELVAALTDIFQEIVPAPATFASASIPAVQSSSADKIYFSSFVPLPTDSPGSQAVWPGRISAFRKPLPLTPLGQPDTNRQCTAALQSGCHLWDAGALLVNQAPTDAEIDDPTNPIFRIGDGLNQRRIFYPVENSKPGGPSDLTLFRLPDSTSECNELKKALTPDDPICVSPDDPELVDFQRRILRRKTIPDSVAPLFGSQTQYVMGDIFHADPLVLDSPNDFPYFANDLCGEIQPEGLPSNCVEGEDRGYRQFAQKHVWRRRMLITATNDGQLHFFEAGLRKQISVTLPDGQTREEEVFTDGTGLELFSYMPRLTLPVVGKQFEDGNQEHLYTLDGKMNVRDVFIDPVADNSGIYNPAEREWRTVLVAGLREAGDRFEPQKLAILDVDEDDGFVPGYFALDLTQPDVIRILQRNPAPPSVGPIVNSPLAADSDEPLIPDPEGQQVPSCLNFNYSGNGRQAKAPNCPYPFPMELWTFIDGVDNRVIPPVNGRNDLLNEDWDADGDGDGPGDGEIGDPDNNEPDLGETWSQPVIGQIAYCDFASGTACNPNDPDADEDISVLHVAVFGGGMDPDREDFVPRGNWLYMVDIETGEAVYKRRLDAAAPGAPTVLDTDRDGIFDFIYIGTIDGTVYKVDLTQTNVDGNLPGLESVEVTDFLGGIHNRDRLADDPVPGDPLGLRMWDPRPILLTRDNAPIYHAPAAFFVPEIEQWGLAIGTGDRENITDSPDTDDFPGRFYVFVDGICNLDTNGDGLTDEPIDDDPSILTPCLFEFDVSDPFNPPPLIPNNENLLLDPGGWVMNVGNDFRMSSRPFLVFGVLIFSMFNGEDVPVFDSPSDEVLCATSGLTRSFVVQVQNGNPVADLNDPLVPPPPPPPGDPGDGGGVGADEPGAEDRFSESPDLTTAPFVDRTSSKNPNPDATAGDTLLDLIDQDVGNSVRNTLTESFPRGSRFNEAHQVMVNMSLRSTGTQVLVTVPVAIFPADWNEP